MWGKSVNLRPTTDWIRRPPPGLGGDTRHRGPAGWERKRDGEFVTSGTTPFATYMYMIFGIVGNQGSIQTDIEVRVAKREVSDEGVLPGGSSIVQRISKFSLFPNRRLHLGALLWHIDGL